MGTTASPRGAPSVAPLPKPRTIRSSMRVGRPRLPRVAENSAKSATINADALFGWATHLNLLLQAAKLARGLASRPRALSPTVIQTTPAQSGQCRHIPRVLHTPCGRLALRKSSCSRLPRGTMLWISSVVITVAIPVHPTAILRGLACSALGSVSVSTPSFISARICPDQHGSETG